MGSHSHHKLIVYLMSNKIERIFFETKFNLLTCLIVFFVSIFINFNLDFGLSLGRYGYNYQAIELDVVLCSDIVLMKFL